MRVLYILRSGRLSRLRDDGQPFPDEMFYGYLQLRARPGWSVELRERRTTSALLLKVQELGHWVTHLFPEVGDASELTADLRARFDAILSTSEPTLLMLALRPGGARLVQVLMGWEKRLARSRFPSLTRRVMRWLGERLSAVVVLGEGERDFLVREQLVPAARVHVIQFGVDAAFWTPGAGGPGEAALAVGNDDGRDYDTLLAAIGNRPLRLHTSLEVRAALPANVTRTRGGWSNRELSDAGLRDLYRRARMVVVPLTDSSQPQGQSVTLQAMACGRPVILTRTRGLWSPALMRHQENCWLVPPRDPAALREAIERLWTDEALAAHIGQAAAATAGQHFTSARMADDLGALLARVG